MLLTNESAVKHDKSHGSFEQTPFGSMKYIPQEKGNGISRGVFETT